MAAGVGVAFLFSIDPTGQYLGLDSIPALKYLPVELALFALPWFLLRRCRGGHLSGMGWALVVATIMVLAGASYTVVARGNSLEASFMGRALGLTTLLPAFLVVRRPRCFQLVHRWVWGGALLSAIVISSGLLVWAAGVRFVDEPHIYHEEVFIPVAVAVAVYLAFPPRLSPVGHVRRNLLIVFLLIGGIASMKNTGFLAVVIGGGVMTIGAWRQPAQTPEISLLRRGLMVEAGVAVVAATVAIVLTIPNALPTGTPELRLSTYLLRLTMFVESPLFGTLYVGTPGVELGSRVVQSHSDLLDIIAFGGILGIGTLLVPVGVAASRAMRRVLEVRSGRIAPGEAFLWVALPLLAMEMVFNPIWHQPHFTYIFAIALAMILHHTTDGSRVRGLATDGRPNAETD